MLTIVKLKSSSYYENSDVNEQYYREDNNDVFQPNSNDVDFNPIGAQSYYAGGGCKKWGFGLTDNMGKSLYSVGTDQLGYLLNGIDPINKEKTFFTIEKPTEKPQFSKKDITKILKYLETNWDGNDINLREAMAESKKDLANNRKITKKDIITTIDSKKKNEIKKTYFKNTEETLGHDACLSAPKDFTLLYFLDSANKDIYEKIYYESIQKTLNHMEEKYLGQRVRYDKEEFGIMLDHFVREWDGDMKSFRQAKNKAVYNFKNNIPVDKSKPAREISSKLKTKLRDNVGRKYIKIGCLFAVYNHKTARPVDGQRPDPQLHSHVIISKRGLKGKDWVAVETDQLFDYQKEVGAYFRTQLADGLRNELGFETTGAEEEFENEETNKIEKTTSWKIKGISDKQRLAFSSRSKKILATAGKDASSLQKKLAGLNSREKKQDWALHDLIKVWEKDAQKVNLTQKTINELKTFNNNRKDFVQTEKYLTYVSSKRGIIDEVKLKTKLREHEQYTGIKAEKVFSRIVNNNLITKKTERTYSCNVSVVDAVKSQKSYLYISNVVNKDKDDFTVKISSLKDNILIDNLTDAITSKSSTHAQNLVDYSSLESMEMELGLLDVQLRNENLTEEQKAAIQKQKQDLAYKIAEERKRKLNEQNKYKS